MAKHYYTIVAWVSKVVKQTIEEKIKQRRLQILVHSFIYYDLNENIISDDKWSQWAKELVFLQKEFPEISKKVIYYDTFKDFDGSTGFDLDYRNPDIIDKAYRLLRYHKRGEHND